MADTVMRMSELQVLQPAAVKLPRIQRLRPEDAATLHRQPERDEQEERTPRVLQMKDLLKELPGDVPTVTPRLSSYLHTLGNGGQPIPDATRSFFQDRFSYDFSQVRVHTDARAAEANRQVNACAFTLGRDIAFGAGQYAPGTTAGRRLIAHELVHVVQQQEGSESSPDLQPSGVVQRAISPELDQIESYLSYGFFDWAITDKEAIKALELLKTLPRYQQAVFFANPKYVGRLRDNLPEDRVQELDDLAVGLAPIAPPTPAVEDIRSKLSYGLFDWVVTDKEAIEALEMLKQLSGVQLAVALGSINYSRLMDNLPDLRKQELIDLLAQGLGTSSARETEEKQYPGAIINSITFTSDHGVMKDNNSDWSSSGGVYPQPEWSSAGGNIVSHPISQTKDSSIHADVSLNVLPVTAPAAPIKLTGRSDVGFLNFGYSSTMHGGIGQTISMVSTGKLPNSIAAIQDKYIHWTLEWRNWKHELGRTGPHTIFVTIAAIQDKYIHEVTHRRMALAVRLTGEVGTLDPHPLVRGIMQRWGFYDLDIRYPDNAWRLADNLEAGAQCIYIVRFVSGLLQTIGAPGTAEVVVVSEIPDPGSVGASGLPTSGLGPLEEPWGTPNPGLWKVPNRPFDGKEVFAGLMDSNGCPNTYEAALKFTYSSITKYYPGGVDMSVEYLAPTDVLHVFQCLAWLSGVARKVSRIEAVIETYPGGSCPLGTVRCR